MANIKSQIKRNRQNEKRRVRNRTIRGAARTAVTQARNAFTEGTPETKDAVLKAISMLDQAAVKGVIHPNNASRRKGRLMKSGRLSDMLDLQAHGWELVVGSVSEPLAGTLAARARRMTRISEGRYTLELPLEPSPDRFVTELAAAGAVIVSLNPLRDTLEDLFVEQVAKSGERS